MNTKVTHYAPVEGHTASVGEIKELIEFCISKKVDKFKFRDFECNITAFAFSDPDDIISKLEGLDRNGQSKTAEELEREAEELLYHSAT